MKTGFDLVDSTNLDEDQVDFLRKTVAILKVLSQEACATSERFTKACGRTTITGNDMYYALMYEAHEFFQKDIDARFFDELETEREHTYITDDESEEDKSDDSETSPSDEEETTEPYTIELKDNKESEFHAKVLQYSKDWREWFPQDPVQQMMKKYIDETAQKIPFE